MKGNLPACMPVILRYEGGFSDHPRDPGGRTLEGIIQRVYDGYRERNGLPRKALTAAMRGTSSWITERDAIYRKQYWNAIRGDELPAGVDLFVFDCAVNSGPFQAVKWLQRALGNVEVDGHLGESTLAALALCDDHDLLIADMAARRMGMLKSLKTWSDFGRGWSARVGNVKAIAQAWAIGSVGPAPVEAHRQQGDAKGYASDVAQPMFDAHQAGTSAVGGASLSGLISGTREQLAALVGTSNFVNTVYVVLTVAGIVVAVGGVAYGFWSNRKSRLAQRAIDGDVLAEVPEGQPA
jgi:lysozyme family protein